MKLPDLIKWDLRTNHDMRIDKVADAVNQLIAYLAVKEGKSPVEVCPHGHVRQTKNGNWLCEDCKKFIKAPQ